MNENWTFKNIIKIYLTSFSNLQGTICLLLWTRLVNKPIRKRWNYFMKQIINLKKIPIVYFDSKEENDVFTKSYYFQCVFKWSCRDLFCANFFKHRLHSNFLSSKCIASCFSRFDLSLNCLRHTWHAYGFSPSKWAKI